MFVTAEKEGQMFTMIFLFIFVNCCPLDFKQGQDERVHTTKAQTNRPRSQLYLM